MAKKFELGLFMGRFQPFHKGHLYALKYSASKCRGLVVGIGSAGESGTTKNPISSGDRIRIIKAALKDAGIGAKRIKFLEVPDFRDNDKWFDYIMKRDPDIDVVFSRHWLVKKIFRERNFKVITPPWHRRGTLVATRIRKMMKEGRDWKQRVPKGAVKEIASHEKVIKRL